MRKILDKALLLVVSIFLGIIIITQYHTAQSIVGKGKTPSDKTAALNSEMAKLNAEKNQLHEELDKLRQESKEIEKLAKDRETELKRIETELNKQKILSGYYDVKGSGAIIKIDEAPNSYVNLAYSHQFILALISYLNNAGVEAISINGQRYTNYTEIVPVLDHINVNGVALVLPLEIRAIGNARTIEASLNFVGGIVSQMTEIGFTIEAEYPKEVQINKYVGEKELKYAVPIEPNEQQMEQ